MIRLEIPNYLDKVEIRKTTKPKYLTPRTKLPKKYQTNEYCFARGVLVVRKTGLPVITNAKSLSQATSIPVNGQHIYNGNTSMHVRAKLIHGIKDSLRHYVAKLPQLTQYRPLAISLEVHKPIGARNWDVDNLWLWHKCFQDLLVELGKLPDDNVKFITSAGKIDFYPVTLDTERKLVFVIEQDNRQCVNNEEWKAITTLLK